MSNVKYKVDGVEVSVEEFRQDEDRSAAEDFLVNAYQETLGDMVCSEHGEKTGYELNYESASGQCKIRTEACCENFDRDLNMALMMKMSEQAEASRSDEDI
ncbi:hypothetical protein HCH_04788 [Hahella chejuensis KCTC 2396]|uniref:Uncharacterized protein n=1 Tax=Hahella chejuensis (strain KCTC 2396) TaxID=349521 RepID=Q2SCZ2_HAHCH|nr:hypothetical protein [Hahella chejuensis]ABC31482.1 hypothetical protein HCH_04788 [Hahella chejuensis KCTC 2396]